MMNRHPSTSARIAWVLAFSLMVKAMVPAGFMPAAGQWVELCTVDGVIHVWAGDNTDSTNNSHNDESPNCPWAGVLPIADGPKAYVLGHLWLAHAHDQVDLNSFFLPTTRWIQPSLRAPPPASLPT